MNIYKAIPYTALGLFVTWLTHLLFYIATGTRPGPIYNWVVMGYIILSYLFGFVFMVISAYLGEEEYSRRAGWL